MSLKPIDMQVIVPKTTEVSKMQQAKDHGPQNDQQLLAQAEEKRNEVKQTQVQDSSHLVKPANEEKQKDRSKKNKKGNMHGNDELLDAGADNEVGIPADPDRGHNLDLKF